MSSKSSTGICAVAIILCSTGLARADYVGNNVPLYVGGSYIAGQDFTLGSTNYYNSGSGPIAPSSLNGTLLSALYCVDIPHDVFVGNSYTAHVNTQGIIFNDSTTDSLNGGLTLADSSGKLTNAGNIAYLMTTYAAIGLDLAHEQGLQAAIWKEVYGSHFTYNNTGDSLTAYNGYLSGLVSGGHSDLIGNVFWINPNGTNGDGSKIQGLVGTIPGPPPPPSATPVPSNLVMSSILLGMVGMVRGYKRLKIKAVA